MSNTAQFTIIAGCRALESWGISFVNFLVKTSLNAFAKLSSLKLRSEPPLLELRLQTPDQQDPPSLSESNFQAAKSDQPDPPPLSNFDARAEKGEEQSNIWAKEVEESSTFQAEEGEESFNFQAEESESGVKAICRSLFPACLHTKHFL